MANMGPTEIDALWLQRLVQRFHNHSPGYTIYPIWINRSAVETFFSQVKHVTSGHLSSTNYATARGSVITKGSINGKLRKTTS